jgi:nicotinamide-nucleotide amidase
MRAEIITIGDEILIGQIVDTNSQWIGTELNKIGVSVYQISSVQDEKQHILNALKEAESRVDIVLITGGLGPTKDDITKHTIAEYFKDTLLLDEEVVEHVKELFAKINYPFTEINRMQGLVPTKATVLKNQIGTAPGMWFYENETVFVSMPGVPNEMKGLMKYSVLPKIQKQFKLPFIIHKTIMTYGQGESIVATRIEKFEDQLPDFIKLAYLPNYGRLRLRLSAKGENKELLERTLKNLIDELYQLIPDIITGIGEEGTIERKLGNELISRKLTLGTAESLTGGKIAASLVNASGASAYFKGSFVTYCADAKKSLLDVSETTIQQFTVVSKEVAEEMAVNARKKLDVDYAISVTGNAGPTKDANTKEVGQVYISIASETGVFTKEYNFGKPREKVINRTVNKSLEILLKEILKN